MTTTLLILGGGGFGREVAGYIRSDIDAGRLEGVRLCGFFDDNPDCQLALSHPNLPRVGRLSDLRNLGGDQRVLIAFGSVRLRREAALRLLALGLPGFTYVHPSATVAEDAVVGEGSLIAPGAIVNAGARVGAHVAVNVLCSIGHGARIGDYSILSPYAAVNGDASLGSSCFMGTRATVFPGVTIGNFCTVDTHAFVRANVGDRKIVTVRGQYLVLDDRRAS